VETEILNQTDRIELKLGEHLMEAVNGKDLVQNEKRIASSESVVTEDEFLSMEDLVPVKRQAAERSFKRTLSEMAELTAEKKWEDILEIFYPVDEKIPELSEHNLDAEIRAKTAFALGHVKRFDEAIQELHLCIKKDPENFHFHSSLAYTAYNSLYAAKNREILLNGKSRLERIELAHRHFIKAQELRPDGVTNYYRQGMLFKQIENKNDRSLPLFQNAVANWTGLDARKREERQQERKNYVKSLYQLSGCLLNVGKIEKALEYIKLCLSEDEKSNYYSLVYKYFALGKVLFHNNAFSEAKDALLFALQCGANQPVDFVYELLGRTYLAMGKPQRAMEVISKLPEKKRRPYYRWTEADILCALQDYKKAKAALISCKERDNRSKHKALVRLSKIEYLLGNFRQAMDHAAEAVSFFNEKWGGLFNEGIFWQALSAYRAGELEKARDLSNTLKAQQSSYPGLDKLRKRLFPGTRMEG